MSSSSQAPLREVPFKVTNPELIPKERYYDEEFFRLEKEHFWSKVWQMACRLEEIPELGDWVEYRILDQSVLIVRTNRWRKSLSQRLPSPRAWNSRRATATAGTRASSARSTDGAIIWRARIPSPGAATCSARKRSPRSTSTSSRFGSISGRTAPSSISTRTPRRSTTTSSRWRTGLRRTMSTSFRSSGGLRRLSPATGSWRWRPSWKVFTP